MHDYLLMGCVSLLGTTQILKPWNQIGLHHLHFLCSALISTPCLLFITAGTENSVHKDRMYLKGMLLDPVLKPSAT